MPLPKTKSQLEIEKLWRFEGRDAAFWVELLRVFGAQIEASSGMILVQLADGEGNKQWTPRAVWPDAEETRQRLAGQRDHFFKLADEAIEDGRALVTTELDEGILGAALSLRVEDDSTACVAAFVRYGEEDFFRPGDRIEKLMVDSPLIYGANPFASSDAASDTLDDSGAPLATAVALGLLVNEEKRFLAAAMVFCNEIAARFSADRVSLGWLKGHYLLLKATNHAEKINRKMEISRLLEATMEECLDQDDEVVWPGTAAASTVQRDHELYARKVGIAHLASVPLRDGIDPVSVITLEREEPFSETDLQVLRLSCDLCVRRLADLHTTDRWFGARWASSLRKGLGKLIGFEHTWAKIIVLAVAALFAFLAFYPWPFKVEASYILQPQQIYHLPAPFDGYIESVAVKAGDPVKANDILMTMDTAELKLNLAELSATVQRFVSEAQLARAESSPAEMHIAIAKAEETKATLRKVQFNLEMATVQAPKDGVVLEGDIDERIGSPVTRGEALLKVSQLDGMFAELRLPEREATRVKIGSRGEAAFESRPEERFAIEVTQIEPLAVAEEGGNMLIVRTRFAEEGPDWWRPGMTGVAKLDCGKRSLLWIFTRRAIDYLRMKFWF